MGIANIGWSGLLLVVIVLVFVFGPSKMPEIGRAFGRTLREFKESTKEIMQDAAVKDEVRPSNNGHIESSSSVEK